MNKFLKSILKTAIYLLDQSDRVAADMRDRVADRVDEVSDRVSDLRNRARDLYGHEDHTLRNIMTFAAGVGVGIGAGCWDAACPDERRGYAQLNRRKGPRHRRPRTHSLLVRSKRGDRNGRRLRFDCLPDLRPGLLGWPACVSRGSGVSFNPTVFILSAMQMRRTNPQGGSIPRDSCFQPVFATHSSPVCCWVAWQ